MSNGRYVELKVRTKITPNPSKIPSKGKKMFYISQPKKKRASKNIAPSPRYPGWELEINLFRKSPDRGGELEKSFSQQTIKTITKTLLTPSCLKIRLQSLRSLSAQHKCKWRSCHCNLTRKKLTLKLLRIPQSPTILAKLSNG